MAARADAKHYTASEIFLLTSVSPEKQYQWDDRGITVPSRKDKRSTGSGDPTLKSIETVYQIAITATLVGLGVGPKRAGRAARHFTDQPQPGRAAGELFAQGRTMVCIRESGPVVINAPYHADFCELSDHAPALVAVDVGKICKDVELALTNLK